MALSEEERRLLAQMEAALAAEDPKLAHAMRGNRRPTLRRRRAALAGIGFFAGIALLVTGLVTTLWPISVVGFALMFGGVVVAVSAWNPNHRPQGDQQPRPDPTRTPGGGSSSTGFMDKMEERWRRRQDEGM